MDNVSSLRTFVPFYTDQRFAEYVREDFFTPAPPLIDPTNLTSLEIPDVEMETVIFAPVDQVPPAPAFVGFGAFSLEPGTTFDQRIAPAFQVLRLTSGSLTVTAAGPTQISSAATDNQQVEAPIGQTFVVQAGDQLTIPENTPIAISSNPDQATDFLTVTIFVIRSSIDPQLDWTEGAPSPDLFEGIPRRVLAGGVSMVLPPDATTIQVDRTTAAPGAFFPKHVHPGPELIAVEQGEFTIFAAPPNELTVTRADGQVAEGEFDTPISLAAGSKALVQGYQVHRGRNLGDVPAVFFSTRVYNASEPPFIMVGPSQRAVQFVNLDGDNNAAVVSIVSKHGQYDERHQELVTELREEIIPAIPELEGYTAYVGGDAAGFMDFRDRLYGQFPLVAGVVMLLIFVILMMFFQSVFLPLKAIFMNLVSVLATYGVLIVIFQYGHGASLLGFESQGLVSVVTPAVLFVILFALSTDYEVFMLSRVKEYYHQTHNNEESVAAGLQHTAGVITAAGLILIGTFGSFATARVVTIKEIGIGLA
ncbi:MAG: MMPL family transporter, partial [Thermomicrobiales bacterium]